MTIENRPEVTAMGEGVGRSPRRRHSARDCRHSEWRKASSSLNDNREPAGSDRDGGRSGAFSEAGIQRQSRDNPAVIFSYQNPLPQCAQSMETRARWKSFPKYRGGIRALQWKTKLTRESKPYKLATWQEVSGTMGGRMRTGKKCGAERCNSHATVQWHCD
jgi:hypothetical protein